MSGIFARLADILLPEGGWVVTIAEIEPVEVYIDESGSHDGSPILSVGGFVFAKEGAIEFDREWKLVLEEAELPYFRMSAAAHLTEPFQHKTHDQADQIERKLIDLTKRTSVYGFVVTVNEDEYNAIGPKHPGLGSAYSFCLRQCLVAIRWWADHTEHPGKIAYFFEAGHRDQHEAGIIMERVFRQPTLRAEHRYSAHAFASKADARPLQAADLWAWQWHTDAKRKRAGIKKSRKDLQALVREGDRSLDWTKDRLYTLAQQIESGGVLIF